MYSTSHYMYGTLGMQWPARVELVMVGFVDRIG
ncbi:hypothetical protein RHDC3_02996 [Rhodocyclaceae bacterium]|nr:hypothetical protein RHDC3_02996 [Rhodocyclaceae bacterium]